MWLVTVNHKENGINLDCEQSLIFLLSLSGSRARVRGREERGRKPERRKINISSFFSLAVHGSEERKTTACGLMLIVYSYKI